MADRWDREYDRDRSLWRDDEEGWGAEREAGRGRQRGQTGMQGEFGGSTRRGWGRSGEFDEERGYFGRGRGEQFASERGYGRDYETDYYAQGYGRGGMTDRDYYGPQRQRDYDSDYYGQARRGPRRGWGRGQASRWVRQADYDEQYYGEQDYGAPSYGAPEYGAQDWRRQPGRGMGTGEDQGTWTWTYTEHWLVPGPYTGMGPRNYRRSAERIKDDVCERLTRHGQLDASNLEVDVTENGEVVLRGMVNTRHEKRMAEDVAESVMGVADVRNEIRVQRQDQGARLGQYGQVGQSGQMEQQDQPTQVGQRSAYAAQEKPGSQAEK